MTYLQILNIIKDTALAQPNVNTVVREFIDLNRENTEYSAVVIQDRDGLRDRISEQDYITYTWHLGYVDRLTYDDGNRDDIFSTGINVINNIVNSIRNTYFPQLEVRVIDRFNTFNQRFTASCAGVYVVLAIDVAVSDCVDGEQTEMYDKFSSRITENGHYHFIPDGRPVDEIDITVNVDNQKQEERLVEAITSNGSYHYEPSAGSVFSDVSIAVDVPVKIEERLVEAITSNGSYHYDPTAGSVFGNADITVSVPEKVLKRYQSSFDVSPSSGNIFLNPSDIDADGFSEVDIEMGINLNSVTETITSNGSYHYESGDSTVGNAYINYVDITVAVSSTVTVEISQTGYDNLQDKDPNTIYLING